MDINNPSSPQPIAPVTNWDDFWKKYFSCWINPTTAKIKAFVYKVFDRIAVFFIDLYSVYIKRDFLERDTKYIQQLEQKQTPQNNQISFSSDPIEFSPSDIDMGNTPLPENREVKKTKHDLLVESTKKVCVLFVDQILEKYIPEKEKDIPKEGATANLEHKSDKTNEDSFVTTFQDLEKSLEKKEKISLHELIKNHAPKLAEFVAIQVEKILRSMDIAGLSNELMGHFNRHANAVLEVENIKWNSKDDPSLPEAHQVFERTKEKANEESKGFKELKKREKEYQKVLKKRRPELFLNKIVKNPEEAKGIWQRLNTKENRLKSEQGELDLKLAKWKEAKELISKNSTQFGKEELEEKNKTLENANKELVDKKASIQARKRQLNPISELNQEKLDRVLEKIVSLMIPPEDFNWEYIFDEEAAFKEVVDPNFTVPKSSVDNNGKKPLLDLLRAVVKELPTIIGNNYGEATRKRLEKLFRKNASSKERREFIIEFLKDLAKPQLEGLLQQLTEQKMQELLSLVMPQIEDSMIFVMIKHQFSQPENLELFKQLSSKETLQDQDFDKLWESICTKLSKDYLNKEYGLEDCSIQKNESLRKTFNFEVKAIMEKVKALKTKGQKDIAEEIANHYKPKKADKNRTVIGDLMETLVFKVGNFGSVTGYFFGKFKGTVSQIVSDTLQDFERPEFFLEKVNLRMKEIKKEQVEQLFPVKSAGAEGKASSSGSEKKPPSFQRISKISYAIMKQQTDAVFKWEISNWFVKGAVNQVVPSSKAIEDLIDRIFNKLFVPNIPEKKAITENLWCSLGAIVLDSVSEAAQKVKAEEQHPKSCPIPSSNKNGYSSDEETAPNKTDDKGKEEAN